MHEGKENKKHVLKIDKLFYEGVAKIPSSYFKKD